MARKRSPEAKKRRQQTKNMRDLVKAANAVDPDSQEALYIKNAPKAGLGRRSVLDRLFTRGVALSAAGPQGPRGRGGAFGGSIIGEGRGVGKVRLGDNLLASIEDYGKAFDLTPTDISPSQLRTVAMAHLPIVEGHVERWRQGKVDETHPAVSAAFKVMDNYNARKSAHVAAGNTPESFGEMTPDEEGVIHTAVLSTLPKAADTAEKILGFKDLGKQLSGPSLAYLRRIDSAASGYVKSNLGIPPDVTFTQPTHVKGPIRFAARGVKALPFDDSRAEGRHVCAKSGDIGCNRALSTAEMAVVDQPDGSGNVRKIHVPHPVTGTPLCHECAEKAYPEYKSPFQEQARIPLKDDFDWPETEAHWKQIEDSFKRPKGVKVAGSGKRNIKPSGKPVVKPVGPAPKVKAANKPSEELPRTIVPTVSGKKQGRRSNASDAATAAKTSADVSLNTGKLSGGPVGPAKKAAAPTKKTPSPKPKKKP